MALGYFSTCSLSAEKNSADLKTKQLLLEAKDKAQNLTEEAAKKAQQVLDNAKQEEKTLLFRRANWKRILQREESLEKQRLGMKKSNAEINESIEKLKKKEEIEDIERQRMVEFAKSRRYDRRRGQGRPYQSDGKKYEDILGRIKNWNLWAGTSLKKRARNTGYGHSKAGFFHRFGSYHHHRPHTFGRP